MGENGSSSCYASSTLALDHKMGKPSHVHFIPTPFPSLQMAADLGHDKAGKENSFGSFLKNVFQNFADMSGGVGALP